MREAVYYIFFEKKKQLLTVGEVTWLIKVARQHGLGIKDWLILTRCQLVKGYFIPKG